MAPFSLTPTLREVALLAGGGDPEQDLLPRVLDLMAEQIPYDLAAILEQQGDELIVRCARGPLASEAVQQHRVQLGPRSSVAAALDSRRAKIMEEHSHAEGEDPYHGVLDLPDGHACMVVPLVAADQVVGAMTFDRSHCGVYPPEVLDLATIYGQLIGLSLMATRVLKAENTRLSEQNRLLRESRGRPQNIGASRAASMQQVAELGRQVAQTSAPVLITGETGSGKEVLARAIHNWSSRRKQAFVKINCAALPENLLESELFGHVEGAFSGASADRPGRFLVANGGSLLLDEIGDMPLPAQAKLLRVLQEGQFEAVGCDETITVDVRVLAATHVDLEQAIREGRFRQDLYYRLNLFPIHLPPLRERAEDIEWIARDFLARHAEDTGRGPWSLPEAQLEVLKARPWPGNVRELINLLERATILAEQGDLQIEDPPAANPNAQPECPPVEGGPWPTLDELNAAHIRRTLERTGGKIYGEDGAAAQLGLKPSTLQSRMRKLGVDRKVN